MFGIETALASFTWQHLVMLLVGGLLIYLGIARKWEPFILVPLAHDNPEAKGH